MNATNRQKKLLNFFGVPFSPNLSEGAAGWEIGAIMAEEENRDAWRRYLFLTRDFDSGSPIPVECDAEELARVEIPDEWSASEEMRRFNNEIVGREVAEAGPFDIPEPIVRFRGSSFLFTGKFDFGTRKECQNAVIDQGGSAPSGVSASRAIDYLVIGCGGSKSWAKSSYGRKIEAAILSRREHGKPSIISEEHWVVQQRHGSSHQ